MGSPLVPTGFGLPSLGYSHGHAFLKGSVPTGSGTKRKLLQGIPSGIGLNAIALAALDVPIDPATRTKPLAFLVAQRFHGDRKDDLLVDHIGQIDLIPIEGPALQVVEA
jgi:hypothetical protein